MSSISGGTKRVPARGTTPPWAERSSVALAWRSPSSVGALSGRAAGTSDRDLASTETAADAARPATWTRWRWSVRKLHCACCRRHRARPWPPAPDRAAVGGVLLAVPARQRRLLIEADEARDGDPEDRGVGE